MHVTCSECHNDAFHLNVTFHGLDTGGLTIRGDVECTECSYTRSLTGSDDR